jgi:small GTP-binding protein
MPRLVEGLSRFFGRVEIFALGLESERQAAESALARGQPLEAREHARTIVAALPESPLGLALWADAAEDAWLDHEAATALLELVKKVPWRADVWLRLARAGRRIEWPGAREALERAATAPDEREAARAALLELADQDLAAGDPARAQRWLDRIAAPLGGAPDRDAALRRAECAVARGDLAGAKHEVERGLEGEDPVSGREALVKARLALVEGQSGVALDLALRAFILEADGAGEVLAALVASSRDVVVVDRVRRVVGAGAKADDPMWAAAFAFAEGRRDDARKALSRGLGAGDRSAAAALLSLATETRDLDALHALAARDPALLPPPLSALRAAALAVEGGREREALDRLDRIGGDLAGWAGALRRSVLARWLPSLGREAPSAQANWPEVLHELRAGARALDRLDLVGAAEALAVERERPLRVAVVGEFNAGKSTFLNALLGEDVAPTGVLPTTATLHWVAWAPDPFARVVVRGAPDRVVTHADLKPALASLAAAGARVDRVYIYAPIERLKRVEILDTPGFNAPDPDHIAAARQAFDEAHLAIWLLDATSPMKETERRVLSEIQGLGVPVQILVNKSDRLKPDGRVAVLAHVRESLAAVGLASYTDPVLFSARLSLRGRLGDEGALAASGWPEVEALIAERIVDQSDALRERALRRKAERAAKELAVAAAARAAQDREARAAARARTEALREAAARLRREKQALSAAIDQAIEPSRALLKDDLKPLGALPEERQRADAGLREYLRERFVARLAEPVVAELVRAAFEEDRRSLAPPRGAAAVRAVLMGAVASHDAPAHLLERPLDRVIEAAAEAFASALLVAAEEPEAEAPFAALELRAAALAEAFSAAPADHDKGAVVASWLKDAASAAR